MTWDTFSFMDEETWYWIAQEVADSKHINDAGKIFHEGGEITGKTPETLITDGQPAYQDAFNKEFYTNTKPQFQYILWS